MIDEFIKKPESVMLILSINAFVLGLSTGTVNPYGIPLIILGGYIYFYNRHVMGKTWSIKVETKKELITKGLFKHVRHPLYLGCLTASLGLVISTLSILQLIIFILLNLPYTIKRALLEEEILIKTLKGYKVYMKKTKMFIPRII